MFYANYREFFVGVLFFHRSEVRGVKREEEMSLCFYFLFLFFTFLGFVLSDANRGLRK